MKIYYILLTILLPLVLNLILTPIIISLAHKNKLFDSIDERKTHKGNIPRLGGIGVFISILISAVILYLLINIKIPLAFYISIILVFISGLTDDFKPVKPIVKLLTQIVATLVLLVGGVSLTHVYLPFFNVNLPLGYFSYPLTFLWIIGVTNALNLLDGMDGQAGGVSAIGSLAIAFASLLIGQFDIAILCFLLTGALIGFLYYNLPPARIFMGDSGSLTLGFFLAAIPLLYSQPTTKGKMFLVTIAVLIIPIFDVFAAIIRRKLDNRSFFTPDRGHIHHKFTDFTSLNTKQILCFIYSLCVTSGILGILFLIKTNIYTSLGLLLNIVLHIYIFRFLHNRKKERQ